MGYLTYVQITRIRGLPSFSRQDKLTNQSKSSMDYNCIETRAHSLLPISSFPENKLDISKKLMFYTFPRFTHMAAYSSPSWGNTIFPVLSGFTWAPPPGLGWFRHFRGRFTHLEILDPSLLCITFNDFCILARSW